MTRISEWARQWGVKIIPYTDYSTPATGDFVYRVRDIFTTRDGSWDVSDKPGSIEQWARDAYLRQEFDDAGADHHLFGRCNNADGSIDAPASIQFWTYTDNANRVYRSVKPPSGWANIVMYSSSSFAPERGERGPWAWRPQAIHADTVTGAGLPLNMHVSWFAVWQVEAYQDEAAPPVEPQTDADLLAQVRANTLAIQELIEK